MAESWMILTTGVLIAVLAPAAGAVAGSAVDDASQQQSRQWHTVSAVVTKDPPASIGVEPLGGAGGRPHTTVRWTAPDGTVRTGEAAVAPGVKAGDRTTVRLDRHGSVVRNPVSPEGSLAESIAMGTVAASGTGVVLLGAERAGAHLLNRRRYAQWEKEWAEADSQWHHPQR
ncbi:hypothetical protein EST54_00620 [Streptomyces sioyaensis]|uniref:Membrane protein SCJ1.26 n=1 Tax=Streptomyces sioyaensis TaxID=67364 RepID=A0A4Q1RCN2_9ACTN|nr:hypothetical protein EST54_00620 [Streptomyces sioyaensis]